MAFAPVFPRVFAPTFSRHAAAVAAGNGLLNNLIAYWQLDEASGNAVDVHGGLDATAANAPGSTTGKIGDARTFARASSQYFYRASEAALQCGGSSITFAGWMYFTAVYNTTSLVAKDIDTSREYTLDKDTSYFRFYINGGGSVIVTTPVSSVATSTWYFVVAWWSAVDNYCRIQVNNGTVYQSSNTGTPNNGAAQFRIGARQYPSYEDYHDGYIDEVGFWKRLLTADDRTALYNAGAGLAYSQFTT